MTDRESKIKRLEAALASPATPVQFRKSMQEKLHELKEQDDKETKRLAEKKSKVRIQGGRKIKKKAKQRKITGAKRFVKPNRPKAPKVKAKLPKSVKSFNRGRGASDVARDKQRLAKKPGKRTSAEGNTYYENRSNRSDVSKTHRLEKGGYATGGDLSAPEREELKSLIEYKHSLRGSKTFDWREGKDPKKKRYDELLERYGNSSAFEKEIGIYEKGGSLYKEGGGVPSDTLGLKKSDYPSLSESDFKDWIEEAGHIYEYYGFRHLRDLFIPMATGDEWRGNKDEAKLKIDLVKKYQDKEPVSKGGSLYKEGGEFYNQGGSCGCPHSKQ